MARYRPALLILLTVGVLALAQVGCRGDGSSAEPGKAGGKKGGHGSGRRAGPAGNPDGFPGGERPDGVAVRVAPLVRRDISEIYRTSATLRAVREAPVVARAGGIVRRIFVEEGDRVHTGQLMAQLEDDQALLEFDQARVDLGIAERELERAERLRSENLVSIEEYEQKRNAEAQSKTRLRIAELNVAFTKLKAPFAGTVSERAVDRGATVSQSDAVFHLVDTSRFFADVAVPEVTAARLVPGGPAQLSAIALDELLPAVIERLNPTVDPSTGTVKITLATEPVTGLRAGGFVDVAITTAVHEGALVADAKALVADGANWHLFAVVDGKAARVPVRTGFEDASGVEIEVVDGDLSLEEGSQVVVGGVASLSEGTPVRIDRPQRAGSDGDASGSGDAARTDGSPAAGSQ